MLDVILTNPYRVLGVYSNSPKKEIVANLSKINAFLRVGQSVSFPTDMPSLLNELVRTENVVSAANAKLALPADQFRYAQFWFVNATSFDDIALNNLIAGDIDKALSIWEKREDASSLQNWIVCNLILGNFSDAISCAEILYSSCKNDFVKAILGDNPPIDTKNVEYDFLNKLCDELGVNEILSHVSDRDWEKHISGQAVKPLVDGLLNAVSVAKQSKGNGPEARYKAGTKLMNDTKKPLAELKKLTGKEDLQYQMVADKVGLEILQCGIDYYNGTEDEGAPQKSMELQGYALLIVVGQMARDRCRENFDIIRRTGEEYIVRNEMRRIGERIRELNEYEPPYTIRQTNTMKKIFGDYCPPLDTPSFPNSLGSYEEKVYEDGNVGRLDLATSCIKECEPDLMSIKNKLGKKNQLYIKISSSFVSAVVNAIVKAVNGATSSVRINYDMSMDKSYSVEIIRKAHSIMYKLFEWSMDRETRKYFNRNMHTLSKLYSSTYQSGGYGCYIATMVYGDYDSPQVMVLRGFRDNYLAKRGWGRTFIRYYYKYSPKLVEKLKGCKSINSFIRSILDQFIRVLKRRERPMS